MSNPVERVIEPRPRDLGDFTVRRVLPAVGLQTVGPFIFFDHMGPADFGPGQGVNVRPHPHIGLATVTYLFEGAFMHRDSLGTAQLIRPGDVNWMVAGRGIVHSERTPPEVRDANGRTRAHGIQTWVALPRADEEREPSFAHHGAASLPRIERPGVILTVIAGTAYGQRSPVGVFSPTLYVDAQLAAGAAVEVPDEHEQRACYVAQGRVEIDGKAYEQGQFMVLASAAGSVSIRALEDSRAMLAGGAALDGPRHIYWNFVSSSRERIEAARR
ncbi:MAG: pirin family protein, partial [Steroidobacteraceae bacterium]